MDTAPTLFTSDQIRAPYLADNVTADHVQDEGVLIMPVTHGPARIIRVHAPCGIKTTRFALERLGEEPADIVPEEDNSELCLARTVVRRWYPDTAADGINRFYRTAGQYVYLVPVKAPEKPEAPEGSRSAR